MFFLSEINQSDKTLIIKPIGNSRLVHVVLKFAVASLVIVVAFLASPGRSRADIYRFVTVDGVETFTDAPVNKQAQIIIRDATKRHTKNKKLAKAEKTHTVSLDEIVAKTVQGSINPQEATTDNSFKLRLPRVGGTITSGVGMRSDPIDGKIRHHNGIDIAIREGTPVAAVAAGTVVYSGQRSGYGNTIIVEHNNGMLTLYGHNSRLMVSAGQQVDPNTVISLSGNTGRSTGPHLHFEAWQAGTNVTSSFTTGGIQTSKPQLASVKAKTNFHKQILADGSILFTNIPASIP